MAQPFNIGSILMSLLPIAFLFAKRSVNRLRLFHLFAHAQVVKDFTITA